MNFHSILFEGSENRNRGEKIEPPVFFRDLNFDQIVDAITAGREEYNLKPFFCARLPDLAAIEYRHEIMRDLEREALFRSIKSFSIQMHSMRVHLTASEKSYYKYQKGALFLEAAEIYWNRITRSTRT